MFEYCPALMSFSGIAIVPDPNYLIGLDQEFSDARDEKFVTNSSKFSIHKFANSISVWHGQSGVGPTACG
jgi:hypothetical protein